jgi:hypothetical protein
MTTKSQDVDKQVRVDHETEETQPGASRRLLLRGAEVMLAVILVFVFFLTFLGIIGFSFPQGASLRDLMIRSKWVAEPHVASHHAFDVDVEDSEQGSGFAWLVRTRRLVKTKDSHGIAWTNAESGMELAERDSVQTLTDSGALISLARDNEIDLGENSLIVIRRLDDPAAARRGRTRFLFDGELASDDVEQPGTEPIEITAANGATAILPDGASGSRLKVTTNPDKTSTFSLFSGVAQVTSGGRTVELSGNHAVTVDGVSAPGTPVALPRRPSLIQPADRSAQVYRSAPPRVRFDWRDEPGCDAYRLVISRDPGFDALVYDGRIDDTQFTHGNLPAGGYYWRVSGLSGRVEGAPSATRRLELTRDDVPPPLTVEFPDPEVRDDVVLLHGATEPGAEVFVADRSIAADRTGVFEYALNLQRGVNLVVVEAVDAAGNVAYRSGLIHAKY